MEGQEPLEEMRKAVEMTLTAVDSVAAVAAAGNPIPQATYNLVASLHVATTSCLAVLEDATPRSIHEAWFAKVPSDEEWREVELPKRAARGRAMLAQREPESPEG